MRLSKLLKGIECSEYRDCEVYGLSSNSKTVNGCIFFTLDGTRTTGEKYAKEAVEGGAVAIISQRPLNVKNNVVVKDVNRCMWIIAMRYWDNPLGKIKLIGITGTNGKTTTSHLIAEIMNFAEKNTGIIGTLGAKWNGKTIPIENTTPGFLEFVEIISNMQKDGVEYVVCEVSAHAIRQRRLMDVKFAIGVFTNLTQDHLDYFSDMDDYRNAKMSFFESGLCAYNVVNADTTEGRYLSGISEDNTITYGLNSPADVFGIDLSFKETKTSFIANVLDEIYEIESNLLGEFNVYNLLASITVCSMLGVKGEKLKAGVKQIRPIKGRFNVYKGKKTAIIDYAHTPDGLKNLLKSSRKLTCGNLICVFGCGGERDKAKRSIMGKIAEEYADVVVLTEDNSRSECTLDIIKDIASEMISEPKVIPDRRQATEYALHVAGSDDVVVIAGKGGEEYIERSKRTHYSDEEEVKRILSVT